MSEPRQHDKRNSVTGQALYERALFVRKDKLAAIGGARIVGMLQLADQLADVLDELNPAAVSYLDDYGAVVTVNP